MPTNSSCGVVAVQNRPHWPLLAAMGALLSGCATMPAQQAAERPLNGSPSREAQSLDGAVTSLGTALLARAQLDSSEQRVLVVDPPVDLATVRQAAVTRDVERRIVGVIGNRFPHITPIPMGEAALERRPVVLLSCMTPVAASGLMPSYTEGPAKVYRIWASLSDTRTGKVVSSETAWVRADDVDTTPTPFFQDSPVWMMDRSMQAYLKVCGGKTGDTMDQTYLDGMRASIAANDATKAYESERYPEALAAYTRASLLPGGDQIRVWNGVYLSNLALGRTQAAEQAFGHMVDSGLEQGKLAVKFVFRPNSAQFWQDPFVNNQYPVWLRQIARRSATRDTCLLLTGHSSPTGETVVNEVLSKRRAQFVRRQLVERAPVLQVRTEARGRGSRDVLVGTGRDNATDMLDRRVEFEPRPCGIRTADQASSRTPA